MIIKQCIKCHNEYPLLLFFKHKTARDGHRNVCKYCVAEERKKYYPRYAALNKEKISKKNREWYSGNKDEVIEKRRIFKEENAERLRRENTERVGKWNKKKRLQSVAFRIHNSIGCRLRDHLKRNGITKNGRRTFSLLGYDIQVLMGRLEGMFTKDMSWNNYGRFWEIDHIKPLCMFQDEKTALDAWELDNLQPLKIKENREKGGRTNAGSCY
jgi:hypothetical protein